MQDRDEDRISTGMGRPSTTLSYGSTAHRTAEMREKYGIASFVPMGGVIAICMAVGWCHYNHVTKKNAHPNQANAPATDQSIPSSPNASRMPAPATVDAVPDHMDNVAGAAAEQTWFAETRGRINFYPYSQQDQPPLEG